MNEQDIREQFEAQFPLTGKGIKWLNEMYQPVAIHLGWQDADRQTFAFEAYLAAYKRQAATIEALRKELQRSANNYIRAVRGRKEFRDLYRESRTTIAQQAEAINKIYKYCQDNIHSIDTHPTPTPMNAAIVQLMNLIQAIKPNQ